jgi:hypothetical protein
MLSPKKKAPAEKPISLDPEVADAFSDTSFGEGLSRPAP